MSLHCVYCQKSNIQSKRNDESIDEFDELLLKCILYHIGDIRMTPAEEKFRTFFNAELVLVSEMTDDVLREHIISLSDIAFEAKARLTAADADIRERNAKKKFNSPIKSIEIDDVTTEAINRIGERQKRLSKEEKLIENLMKLPGITREIAQRMISPATQIELATPKTSMQLKEDDSIPAAQAFNPAVKPFASAEIETNDNKPKASFKFVNPFEKK